MLLDTATMRYDEGGRRVKKVGTTTTYYLNDNYEIKDGVVTKHILAGNQKLVVLNNNVAYYFHGDHLGSAAVMTDATGAVVETTEYLPFGAVRAHTGNSVSNYKYTGQELDPESGLYYFKSRYYDNVLARFISPDGIYPNLYDPQALNGYTYCGNNPLIYTDPSGHNVYVIAAVIIGIVIGAVTAGFSSQWNIRAVLVGGVVGGIAGGVGSGVGLVAGEIIGAAIADSLTLMATCAAEAAPMIAIGYSSGAFWGSIIGGAAGGATSGGLSAAMNGGNVLQSMLMGAAIGAATAFAFQAIGEAMSWAKSPTEQTGNDLNDSNIQDFRNKVSQDRIRFGTQSASNEPSGGITIDAAKVFDNCMKQYRDVLGDTVYNYLDEHNALKSVSTFAKFVGKELAIKGGEIGTEIVHEVVVGMGGYAPKAYFYTGLLSKAATVGAWYSAGAYTLGTSFMNTAETYCGIVAGYNPFFK